MSDRDDKIKKAFMFSLISKGTTMFLQLVSFPVAIRVLGKEQFAIYVVMANMISFFRFINLGIGPTTTVEISHSLARKDDKKLSIIISTAVAIVIIMTIGVLLFSIIYFKEEKLLKLFSPRMNGMVKEISASFMILLIIAMIQPTMSVLESVQNGYQEQYLINLYGAIGNLLSGLAIIIVGFYSSRIVAFIIALNGPLLIARAANIIGFLVKKKDLITTRNINKREAIKLIKNGFVIFIAITLGSFISINYPVIYYAKNATSRDIVLFGSVINIYMLLYGFTNMVIMPLYPAMAEAYEKKEKTWVQRTYKKIIYGLIASFIGLNILLLLIGKVLFMKMYLININYITLLLLPIMVVLSSCETINYYILLSFNKYKNTSVLIFIRAIATLTIWMLIIKHGVNGYLLSVIVALMMFSGFTLPMMINKKIKTISDISETKR